MANIMFDNNANGPWSYIAGAVLAAGTHVKLSTTAGQIVNCGVGDIPIGIVFDDVASGAYCTVYPSHGSYVAKIGATLNAIGDYLKMAAGGVLIDETTPTTATNFTVGTNAGAGSLNSYTPVVGYY